MRRFEDKVCLITGASGGIGRATAERLAGEGATLFITDLDGPALEETRATCVDLGATVRSSTVDVRRADQAEGSVQAVAAEFGRLDVLVNIAGILRFDHTAELTLENWQRILDVNLTGTFLMCRAAIPRLLESKGNIVNTSSTSGLRGLPYGAAYAASKAGVLGFSRSLAVELGRRGVRVNCVCPGSIETAMATPTFPDGIDERIILRHMSLRRFAPPSTVASVVAMLASSDGAHITGEEVRMDGGALA